MPERHEQMHGIEVGRRDRANGTVAIDEGVPHRKPLVSKEDVCPEIYGEVIGQVAGATIVEIEKDRLSRARPVRCDARVAAKTVAVAERPGQVVYGGNASCEA